MTLPIAIDITVSLLLVVTIAYAMVLNRRLGRLRRDKAELEGLANSFANATIRAEDSIRKLKASADDLAERLKKAENLRDDLNFLIERGSGAADRLEAAVRDVRDDAALSAAQERGAEQLSDRPRQNPAAARVAARAPSPDQAGPLPAPELRAGRPMDGRLDAPEQGGARSEAERELMKALEAAR